MKQNKHENSEWNLVCDALSGLSDPGKRTQRLVGKQDRRTGSPNNKRTTRLATFPKEGSRGTRGRPCLHSIGTEAARVGLPPGEL